MKENLILKYFFTALIFDEVKIMENTRNVMG